MSRVEATAPLWERQKAMQRHWPDHVGYCTLRPDANLEREWTGPQCGVELVPLTVSPTYLSARCPSCRVLSIHTRVAPLG